MTREEAIEQIKWYFEEDDGISAEDITKEAVDMAIEALSDPINCVKCENYYETEENRGVEGHCKMDTANLSERTGEWIQIPHKRYLPNDYEPEWVDPTYDEKEHSVVVEYWHCDKCGYEADRHFKPWYNFCPNCGANMKMR